jgi:cobalt/nickel transport system ATP-binding protein
MWVEVPPETREGDILNLGVLHGEYALHCPYEAVNARVLHIHENNKAIVELTRHGIKAGGILIYDMDRFDPADFEGYMEKEEIDIVGAMGKKSKLLAEDYSICVDIATGVIDRTILMALCGKRCMILTSGGMIPHSMQRINEYIERSGIALNVRVLNEN